MVSLPGYRGATIGAITNALDAIGTLAAQQTKNDLLKTQIANEGLKNSALQSQIASTQQLNDPNSDVSKAAEQGQLAHYSLLHQQGLMNDDDYKAAIDRTGGVTAQEATPEQVQPNLFQQAQAKGQSGIPYNPDQPQTIIPAQPAREARPGMSAAAIKQANEINDITPLAKAILETQAAEKNRQATRDQQLALFGARQQNENNRFESRQGQQIDLKVPEEAAKLQKDLDPDASRAGNFGQISNKYLTAQRLKVLATDKAGGVRNLIPQENEELAIGMANMLSSGAMASDSRVQALVPRDALGDVNKFKQWFTSKPTGQGQQEFTQYTLGTINREADLAQKQMQQIQQRRLGAHTWLKKNDPDTYYGILDNYGFGKDEKPYNPAGGSVSESRAPEAARPSVAPHGPTVIQNGHIYNWNSSTGRYE